MNFADDELVFADDAEGSEKEEVRAYWKILIVDDDEEVHSVTKFALSGFELDGKKLEFFDAYSAKEATEVMKTHSDIALILLDVVMEEDEAGLKCVHDIRDTLDNKLVRIVLRTGQPGQAPEKRVILDYDINDYKTKGELTAQKLFTTVVASLRSYKDLERINKNKKALEDIIDATASMYEFSSMEKFISGTLSQLVALLNLETGTMFSSQIDYFSSSSSDDFYLLASTGKYKNYKSKSVSEFASDTLIEDLKKSVSRGESLYLDDRTVIYFKSKYGIHNIIYIEGKPIVDAIDKNMLEIFCANAATAFDNLHLRQEIEETQKEVIFLLGDITEHHSKETGQHVKRVSKYCELLGSRYGLSQSEVDVLKIASPMHDVGKVAISNDILNKPSKLTDEEFAKIKEHADIGYNILKQSKKPIIQAAAIIAREHHEKYNGNGYPLGLKGEDIHIFGRICAIADVFDALAFERVYKKAWDMESIKEFFAKERGESFDAELVDIFLENFEEFVLIKNTFV
ncbi:MAG: DUF3369 domain-containing protein [Campylobacterales bacterium]